MSTRGSRATRGHHDVRSAVRSGMRSGMRSAVRSAMGSVMRSAARSGMGNKTRSASGARKRGAQAQSATKERITEPPEERPRAKRHDEQQKQSGMKSGVGDDMMSGVRSGRRCTHNECD